MVKKEKKREGKRVKNEYKIMLTKTRENGKRRKEERELDEEKEGGVQGSKGKNVRE